MGGREYLVKKLKADCGLGRRQALAVVNIILERMAHHLRLGHTVEFPYGCLKKVERHFSKMWDARSDCPADRDPYMIDWEVNQEGERELKASGPY
jgi:hypothetical protein